MRIHARAGCGWLVPAALLAWDAAATTAGSLPGREASGLSAQEASARNRQDEERRFMEARRALNREEFDRAAELFQALRDKYPVVTSGRYGRFVPDSYYWEAVGRYRQENPDEALMLLDLARVYREAQYYRDGSTWRHGRLYDDVRELRLRIQRQLAEKGDPGAAEAVLRQSEAVLAMDSAGIVEMRRAFAENVADLQARWEEERARFAPDTAAYREMQRQFETRMREWTEEQARLERELRRAVERYRVQMDSTDSQERLLQDRMNAELAEARWLARHARHGIRELEDSAATANAPDVRVYAPGPGGRPVVFSDLHGPVPAGTGVRAECRDAMIEQEALTSLLRLEVDAMPTVRDMLARADDCSAHLRYIALDWLADEGTDEARELLMEVAREHPDVKSRRWAVHGLEHYDAPEVTELLLRMLDSEDHEVQLLAIHGLHRNPSDAGTKALVEFAATSDGSAPEAGLRRQAAAVVAKHGAPALLPTVFDGFESDAVRMEFLEVVGVRAHRGERGVAGWLLPVVSDTGHSERVRARALQAWLRQRSLDLETVEEAYGSLEAADLRDQLLYALYERTRSGTENVDAIIDKMVELARRETDPEVRKRAVYWLGRTGSERAAAFLTEILKEGSLRTSEGRP